MPTWLGKALGTNSKRKSNRWDINTDKQKYSSQYPSHGGSGMRAHTKGDREQTFTEKGSWHWLWPTRNVRN